eukprot:Phypoly_transcript_09252.p1 GENE.Phypoly_transcript_09252~~Phypoly_transcript_09252.p1  ORF type:complete len:260 (+),score=37.93 Phypoly_transcript_09252:634-1413(+)
MASCASSLVRFLEKKNPICTNLERADKNAHNNTPYALIWSEPIKTLVIVCSQTSHSWDDDHKLGRGAQFPFKVPDEKWQGETVFYGAPCSAIEELPARNSLDCIDIEKVSIARDFSSFYPQDPAKFLAVRSSISRATMHKMDGKSGNSFTCFAIWQKKENIVPTPFLVPPNMLKIFSTAEELVASYIGGPVLYQTKEDKAQSVIQLGVIVDFVGFQKNSSVVLDEGNAAVDLDSLAWIGVVDYFPEFANKKGRSQFVFS